MFMERIATGQFQTSGGDAAAPGTTDPAKTEPDVYGFLHAYRQLHENIEHSITKQFKVDIDVYPNDLPRELAER